MTTLGEVPDTSPVDARPQPSVLRPPVRPLPARPRPRPAPHDPAAPPRRGPDRRAVLGTGLVAALTGAAATLALRPEDAGAADPGNALTYGPPPSGGDDLVLLQNALPASGALYLRPGVYSLSGRLVVGPGQDVQGAGGGLGAAATVLRCTGSDSGVEFAGGGGTSGGFRVDGARTANRPFTRSGGVGGVGRTFRDITVSSSAADGIVALAAQNDVWSGVVSVNAARDGLVLDQGYGGALFSRCGFAAAGRYNLRLDKQVDGGPYPAPANVLFEQCIVETSGVVGTSLALINGAYDIVFHHSPFWTGAAMSGPIVDITGGATHLVFNDSQIASGANPVADTGLRVDTQCHVLLDGTTRFSGLATALALRAGTPAVEVHGPAVYDNVAQRYATEDSSNPQSWVTTTVTEPIVSRRTSGDDLAYTSNAGNGFWTFESASGRKVWGNGKDYVGDVAISRRQAGVVGVDKGQLLATGYGTTSQRPAVTPAAAGSIRFNMDTKQLEATDGTNWFGPALRGQLFTSSGTLTVPPGVTLMRIKAIGGGGGGGGGGNIGTLSLATTCYGGAGGGAGMVVEYAIPVTAGDTLNVMIGDGGAGGAGADRSSGTTGNRGANGASGGGTTVTNSAGTILVSAPGGGGGPGSSGSAVTGPIKGALGGAYGCNDTVAVLGLPGCGAFGLANAVPAPHGVCGGASGAFSTTGNGGGSGVAVNLPGLQATFGRPTARTVDGLAGASPKASGCGGNGGGAGGLGGAGGAGGSGAKGYAEIFWVS